MKIAVFIVTTTIALNLNLYSTGFFFSMKSPHCDYPGHLKNLALGLIVTQLKFLLLTYPPEKKDNGFSRIK